MNSLDKKQSKNSQKNSPSETGSGRFNYEVSSTEGLKELSEQSLEATVEKEEKITNVRRKKSEGEKKSTIKILSERDIPLKEETPPNFLPYFLCFLHFKNQPYTAGRLLQTKSEQENK